MEYIRVAKVEDVLILRRGVPSPGSLHLTPHHMIFRHYPAPGEEEQPSSPGKQVQKKQPSPPREIWITYPVISYAQREPMNASGYSALRIRNRDFSFVTFHFKNDKDCKDVFESIKGLSCKVGIERVYAFFYTPPPPEKPLNGWALYDVVKEYERMGIGTKNRAWRISRINVDYKFCASYPALLVVPSSISDNVLNYAAKFRSRERIPALTYLHPLNNCSITRSSQPLTGIRGNRSVQDEKLVAAIFSSTSYNALSRYSYASPSFGGSDTNVGSASNSGESSLTENSTLEEGCITVEGSPKANRVYGAQQQNLIVDARPTVNAYAMQAAGMGSENMDNYGMAGTCSKQYLGIDNIHVMRDSLHKVIEAIKDSDIHALPPNRELLVKSGWLKHISNVLEGTAIIVRQISVYHSHVLIHCSDGWDRTSQLSALAQICLDPYYRTLEGFMILIEKDWLSFGHKFRERSGLGGSEKWFVEKSAVHFENSRVVDDEDQGISNLPNEIQARMTGVFSRAGAFFSGSKSKSDLDAEYESAFPRPSGTPPPQVSVNVKETSPTFHQFLDCVYQLMVQNPHRFEFNERFLRRLLYHVYSCQYGTFLYNNEKERLEAKVAQRTRSVWDYFLSRKSWFVNEEYNKEEDERDKGSWRVLEPKAQDVRWWHQCWGRLDHEMNGDAHHPTISNAEERGIRKKARESTIPSEIAQAATPQTGLGTVMSGIEGLRVGVVEALASNGARVDSSQQSQAVVKKTPLDVEMM